MPGHEGEGKEAKKNICQASSFVSEISGIWGKERKVELVSNLDSLRNLYIPPCHERGVEAKTRKGSIGEKKAGESFGRASCGGRSGDKRLCARGCVVICILYSCRVQRNEKNWSRVQGGPQHKEKGLSK